MPKDMTPTAIGSCFLWKVIYTDAALARHFLTCFCPQAREIILAEGMFDLAVLWQAGFDNVTCALGNHPNALQFRQLCTDDECEGRPRTVYLAFDADANGSGRQAAQRLAQRLRAAGITARRVELPNGHDPNSFFVSGGDARQFHGLLERACL
jgi:DNA primase